MGWGLLIAAGLCVFQQVFFFRQIHKLVDKLMSRSYTEYTSASAPKSETIRVKIPVDPVEDLGAMGEYGN
jgi:hypothetical protein